MNIETFLKNIHAKSKLEFFVAATICTGGRLVCLKEQNGFVLWNLNEIPTLGETDLLLVTEESQKQLMLIARQTSAKLVYVCSHQVNEAERTMVDCVVTPQEFAQFELDRSQLVEKAKSYRGQNLWQDTLRPALFLDRDGVVNVEKKYITDPEQIELMPGVADVIKKAQAKGFVVVVITNQSGLGRDYLTWQKFDEITFKIRELLTAEGVWIDDVEVAPYFWESKEMWAWLTPNRRKPRTAMIQKAARDLRIDLARSVLIGDRSTDIILGFVSGLPRIYMLESSIAGREWADWQTWLQSARSAGITLDENAHRVGLLRGLSDLEF